MVKELRNQLKGQTLGEVSPSSFKQVGGSVYPDSPSAQDLAAFREIVKSFQDVHLPTLGLPIPKTSFYKSITGISSTTTDLITAGDNEVLEIISIFTNEQNYELTTAMLYIYPNGNDDTEYPILSLRNIDKQTNSLGGIIYGQSMDNDGTLITMGQPLYLNGGDTLGFQSKNAPTVIGGMNILVVYRKIMQ